jgi:hypothetical protein
MALPSSGPITMGMINVELAYPATQVISLNDAAVRALAQVPAGVISLSNFYGKSNIVQAGYRLNGQSTQPGPALNTIRKFPFSTETPNLLGATMPYTTPGTNFGMSFSDLGLVKQFAPTAITAVKLSFSSDTISTSAVTTSNLLADGSKANTTPSIGYTFSNAPNPGGGGGVFKYIKSTNSQTRFSAGNDPSNALSNALNRVAFNAYKNYNKGIFGGGFSAPAGAYVSSTRIFNYSTDTAVYYGINPASLFSTVQSSFANFNTAEHGYTVTQSGDVNYIGRYVFSNNTSVKAYINAGAFKNAAAGFCSPTKGYAAGGFASFASPAQYSPATWSLNFSNEAFAVMSPTASFGQLVYGNVIQSSPTFG